MVALEDVCLEIQAGQVCALIGENGAGTSTLMKILSGVYPDYEGRILFKGQPVRFANPREAQRCGIAIIHQELNLVPYLSITENIFLGREVMTSWGTLNQKQMHRKTQLLLEKLKLDVDPGTLIRELKVGQQQVVEIAKALLDESEVIIMDEPTSAISDGEVQVLFGIIEDLKRDNKAIVYVSHKLDELFRIADRFVVLRDGRCIESGAMQEVCPEILIQKMVGRDITISRKAAAGSQAEELLALEHICLKHPIRKNENLLRDISFTLHRGEILGLFGLMGAGRTELLETIFGLHPQGASGQVRIGQQPVSLQSPGAAIRAGLALVPEDRKKDGLVLGLDVQTNICLTTLEELGDLGFLASCREESLAAKYIQALNIKASSPQQQAGHLSGGNQQKIVLAKWLATRPRVLLLDEPTRGIDINAKSEIYKLIQELADAGLGILVVSSELPEILAVADRVLVMAEGRLTAEFLAADATEDNILKAAIPKAI